MEPAIEGRAGHNVTTLSIWIIAAIVLALLVEIVLVETKFSTPDLPAALEQVCGQTCPENVIRLMMDQDAQMLRTDRVRTTMVSRLMIFAIAEIVALLLVSLGAVLVFNRIENTSGESKFSYGKMFFATSFPGLVMCAIGAAVIAFSLYLASIKGMLVTVYDRPVYTADQNFLINYPLILSGQKPESGSEPDTAASNETRYPPAERPTE